MSTIEQIRNLIKKYRQSKYKLYDKTMNLDSFYDLWDRFNFEFPVLNFRISIVNLIVKLMNLKFFLDFQFKHFKLSGYKKAYYGITKYGEGFVDPSSWIEVIKLLNTYLFTEVLNYVAGKNLYKAQKVISSIYESYYADLFTRVNILLHYVLEHTVCGCVICGFTKLSDTKKDIEKNTIKIKFVTPYFTHLESPCNSLILAHHAHICGVTPCGFSRAISIDPRKNSQFVVYANYKQIIDIAHKDAQEQLDRFLINITGIKLLTTSERNKDIKIDVYYEKMLITSIIENVVHSILSNEKVDILTLRNYVNFAKEFVLGRYKKHTKFRRFYRIVDDYDFINYLIQKYEEMGCDRELLYKIVNVLYEFAKWYWSNYKLFTTNYYLKKT
jgi:hypothetical protein